MDESEAYSAWRDRWQEADYTWEGLATRTVDGWTIDERGRLRLGWPREGQRSATLQDIWRGEATSLVSGPDGRFTRFHLPTRWSDGSPTPKARWNRRHVALFKSRLAKACARVRLLNRRVHRNASGYRLLPPLNGIVFPEHSIQSERDLGFLIEDGVSAEHLYISDSVSLSEVCFRKSIRLENTYFGGELHLTSADFEGVVDLDGGSFAEEVGAYDCKFKRNVDIDGGIFAGKVGIYGCIFEKDLKINECKAAEITSFANTFNELWASDLKVHVFGFRRCRVENVSWFSEAEFYKEADFTETEFSQNANFQNAKFKGSALFLNCGFKAQAHFSAAEFPPKFETLSTIFLGARFDDASYFLGLSSKKFVLFNGAQFKRPPVLDAEFIENIDIKAVISNLKIDYQPGESPESRRIFNRRLKIAESALRVLKIQMESSKHREDEFRLYRSEIISRKERLATKLLAKRTFDLYGLVSDYGLSLMRPIYTLVGIWIFFFMLFFGSFELNKHVVGGYFYNTSIVSNAEYSLVFSARNIAKPLSVWDPLPVRPHTWLKNSLEAGGPLGHGWVKFWASIESFLSLLLIFLSGLAAKRRFQVV